MRWPPQLHQGGRQLQGLKDVRAEVLELRTTHPFHIARAAAPPVRRTVWLRIIDDDGVEGWGEAAANAYYGESADTVLALLPQYEAALRAADTDVTALETLERALERAAGGNPAARAAFSAALHDLAGKRLGVPVWRMWGLDASTMPQSSFTLGLDAPDALQRKVEEAASYPILKLKVGSPEDRRLLELVRAAAPERRIRIDANTGWTLQQAIELLPALLELDIELIEQPFAADDHDSFRSLRGRSSIPIVADESCRVVSDIPRLVGVVDGINIKLEKCGSLREAMRMVHVARAHHMQVMLGCMLSSTLAMAAAMQLAPLVDWVDLDGAALLAHDPFDGPHMRSDGTLVLNEEPGLGVTARA
jgi:L-alanine-DL-glutamate epimerase-like enolase superfamily enzyme